MNVHVLLLTLSIKIKMITLVLVSIVVPIILIFLFRKNPKTNLPPGPRALPLIGNLHHLATAGDLHLYLWRLSKQYGPIIHMRLGSTPLVVISSAKLAKEVMKTQDLAFCSRPRSFGQQRLSYDNKDIVFAPYDSYWREVRKFTSIHLFTQKKVQSFRPAREEEIAHMISKISRCAAAGEPADLSEMALTLTSALICRVAFGKKYDEHGSERRQFDKLLQEAQEIAVAFYVSDYFPALTWVDQVTGKISLVENVCRKLDVFYQELIDEHLDPNRAKTDDILDTLIKLKQDSNSGLALTWDNIKALLMDIFIAGTDTSSAAIVWTMTVVMKAPCSVMEKLQAEIRNVIGSEKGRVDEDDLPKLPYLKAVINETFRLYPVAPLLVPRETTERCIIEGFELQPKTVVYVNAWAVARDPDYWEKPDEFMPERFMNKNIDIRGQDFGVIPFGSGRRICPGMPMGLATVELAVANLLYAFDWELPPGIRPQDVDMETEPGIVPQKKNALLLLPTNYVYVN